MNNTQILIVIDDPQTRKLLCVGLSRYNYKVTTVLNAEEATALVMSQRPDIIILDINPHSKFDGLELCQELCEWITVPIIVLAFSKNKHNSLAALNAGADDCITKPFDMDELEARVRVVLRRRAVMASKTASSEIRIHNLVIDPVKRRVLLKGNEIHLTPTEYRLLQVLAAHPGEVLPYSTFTEEIRGLSESPKPEHLVQVYINKLRMKLQDDTDAPLYIYSEPWIGYRFADVQPA